MLEDVGVETVSIMLKGRRLEFNLDYHARKWTAIDESRHGSFPEGEFPLIAYANGKRYELYSDGTFAEVQL